MWWRQRRGEGARQYDAPCRCCLPALHPFGPAVCPLLLMTGSIRAPYAPGFWRLHCCRWRETPVAVKVLLGVAASAAGAAGEGAAAGGAAAADAARSAALSISNPVLENLQKEAALMARLRHPNIVGFLGVVARPPCIVTGARGGRAGVCVRCTVRGQAGKPAGEGQSKRERKREHRVGKGGFPGSLWQHPRCRCLPGPRLRLRARQAATRTRSQARPHGPPPALHMCRVLQQGEPRRRAERRAGLASCCSQA